MRDESLGGCLLLLILLPCILGQIRLVEDKRNSVVLDGVVDRRVINPFTGHLEVRAIVTNTTSEPVKLEYCIFNFEDRHGRVLFDQMRFFDVPITLMPFETAPVVVSIPLNNPNLVYVARISVVAVGKKQATAQVE